VKRWAQRGEQSRRVRCVLPAATVHCMRELSMRAIHVIKGVNGGVLSFMCCKRDNDGADVTRQH
jgi:hypothetical protein